MNPITPRLRRAIVNVLASQSASHEFVAFLNSAATEINANAVSIAGLGGGGSAGVGLWPVSFVLGSGGSVATGTNLTNIAIVPAAATVTKAYIAAKTAPVGAALIVDIQYSTNAGSSWATLWSTTNNRLQLADGSKTGSQAAFNVTALTAGTWLRIDVVQVGSSTAGGDVTVALLLSLSS